MRQVADIHLSPAHVVVLKISEPPGDSNATFNPLYFSSSLPTIPKAPSTLSFGPLALHTSSLLGPLFNLSSFSLYRSCTMRSFVSRGL